MLYIHAIADAAKGISINLEEWELNYCLFYKIYFGKNLHLPMYEVRKEI